MLASLTVAPPEPPYAICLDCRYPFIAEDDRGERTCPNPACFPGLWAYSQARKAWEEGRSDFIRLRSQMKGVRWNFGALEAEYARRNPPPRDPRDFPRGGSATGMVAG